MLTEGLQHTVTVSVTTSDTALAMGSGDMPVLATPALVALMENAAMLTVSHLLPEDSTTIGGFIEVSHLAPSTVGSTVTATATLVGIKGRKLSFSIEAFEGEKPIGKATHIRFIVERSKFISSIG